MDGQPVILKLTKPGLKIRHRRTNATVPKVHDYLLSIVLLNDCHSELSTKKKKKKKKLSSSLAISVSM